MILLIFLLGIIPYGISEQVLQQRGLADNLECAANSIEQSKVAQAWNGYDVWESDIWGSDGDPGRKDLIFKVECLAERTDTGNHHKHDDGYYDFSTVQLDLACESTFVTKIIESLEEYVEVRGGSDEWGSTFSAGAEADATIKGLNIGFSASAAFKEKKSEEYETMKSFFEQSRGEVTMSNVKCSILDTRLHLTGIQAMRPFFHNHFISSLEKIDDKLKEQVAGPFTDEQKDSMVDFIKHYGTHYAAKAEMGARVVIEEMVSSRSTTSEIREMRKTCARDEANGCFGVNAGFPAVFNVKTRVCSGTKKETCRTETGNEKFADTTSERKRTVRTIGAMPSGEDETFRQAVENGSPVPIGRNLTLISKLFTETNLKESKQFNFKHSLNHVGLAKLFEHVAENYCELVLGNTYEDCYPEPEKGCGHNDDCTEDQICTDTDTEKGYECTTPPPPSVDCQWNEWSQWSTCNTNGIQCGKGQRLSARSVKVEAKHGGKECTGPSKRYRGCWSDPSDCADHFGGTTSIEFLGRWGTLGTAEYCGGVPYADYATRFRIQYEQDGGNDPSALNSICLMCSKNDTEICSKKGQYGGWHKATRICTNGFTGFWLHHFWSRLPGLLGQDVGATNLFMQCDRSSWHRTDLDWDNWGKWHIHTCPKGKIICGLQTRVSDHGVDDTGLNGVKMFCCDRKGFEDFN